MRLSVIAILVVAVVGALIYFGFISKEDVEQTGRVAVADVKKLGNSITAPVEGVSPQAVAVANQCRENLKRIESAKRAIADSTGRASGAVSWDEVLRHMGARKPPACPGGGAYSLNTIGTAASCSISGNGTASRDDDHGIMNF